MLVIIRAINYFFGFMRLLVVVRVFLSWVPGINIYSPFIRFIYDATEPIMRPIRELMSRYVDTGFIDFSPIITLILLEILRSLLISLLLGGVRL